MKAEEIKEKKEKGNCCDFGEVFKNFKGMCETMSACCSGTDGSNDFVATMENMMKKGKMEACCGPKTDSKTDYSK